MDVTSNLLSYFRSLVRYEEGQPIRIYHASFYDYLISCEGSAWYIDVGVERENIARRCLERMGMSLSHNICKIPPTYVLNCDVPDLDERVAQCIPPSLEYICCNWAHHLEMCRIQGNYAPNYNPSHIINCCSGSRYLALPIHLTPMSGLHFDLPLAGSG